jgi:hypothetical protein
MRCCHLQGFYLKLGQILATKTDMLPRAYTDALAGLLDALPPVAYRPKVERTLRAELRGLEQRLKAAEAAAAAAAAGAGNAVPGLPAQVTPRGAELGSQSARMVNPQVLRQAPAATGQGTRDMMREPGSRRLGRAGESGPDPDAPEEWEEVTGRQQRKLNRLLSHYSVRFTDIDAEGTGGGTVHHGQGQEGSVSLHEEGPQGETEPSQPLPQRCLHLEGGREVAAGRTLRLGVEPSPQGSDRPPPGRGPGQDVLQRTFAFIDPFPLASATVAQVRPGRRGRAGTFKVEGSTAPSQAHAQIVKQNT